MFKENELDTSSENQSEVSQDTDEKPTFMATVYYADDQTAEITWKDVEVSNEYEVWEALKETGILTDDCELLSLKSTRMKILWILTLIPLQATGSEAWEQQVKQKL